MLDRGYDLITLSTVGLNQNVLQPLPWGAMLSMTRSAACEHMGLRARVLNKTGRYSEAWQNPTSTLNIWHWSNTVSQLITGSHRRTP